MIRIFLVLSIILLSCQNPTPLRDIPQGSGLVSITLKGNVGGFSDKYNYQTVIIDSCEYVFVYMYNASWGSHKGNCKFCAARAAALKGD